MWPAIVGAIGSIAGGLLSRSGQRDANRTNLQIWREQRAWEEELANTSVQRRMNDLGKAGINPMLAGMSGAETPATGMPTMQNEEEEMGKGVASAAQAALVAQQLKIARVQAEALDRNSRGAAMVDQAAARKTNAEAAITEQQITSGKVGTEMFALRRQAQLLGAQIDKTIEETGKVMNEAEIQRQYGYDIAKFAKEAARLQLSEQKAISELYEQFKGAKGAERVLPVIISLFRTAFGK